MLDPIGNFFDTTRVGKAVVRPGDLLALRIELQNLAVEAGTPPKVRKTATGAAYVIVHFPPQTITEKTFFEAKPTGTQNPERPSMERRLDVAHMRQGRVGNIERRKGGCQDFAAFRPGDRHRRPFIAYRSDCDTQVRPGRVQQEL